MPLKIKFTKPMFFTALDRSLRGEYCIIFRVAYRVAYQCKMQHKL